jgi:hypothetical protein
MENAAIVAAWAAAVAAVVGPIVSVAMAHSMMKHENKRTEAAKLFRSIIANAHSFRSAFSAYLYQRERDNAAYSRQHSMQYNPNFHKPGDYDRAADHSREVQVQLRNAGSHLESWEAVLLADILSLRLLFGEESRHCESAIRDLVDVRSKMANQELENREVALLYVIQTVAKIAKSIEPMYDSLRRSDPLGTND